MKCFDTLTFPKEKKTLIKYEKLQKTTENYKIQQKTTKITEVA